MRTTLVIDDDVLELARDRASLEGVSLGSAVSAFVREGLEARRIRGEGEGLRRSAVGVLEVHIDRPWFQITSDDVARALDDDL